MQSYFCGLEMYFSFLEKALKSYQKFGDYSWFGSEQGIGGFGFVITLHRS